MLLRFPAADDAVAKLIAGAEAFFGNPETLLLLSLLHPSDSGALVNQRGRFLESKALDYVLEILSRHLSCAEFFHAPVDPGERSEFDTDADVFIARIDRALEQVGVEQILDCDDRITWWREAPLRRRSGIVRSATQVDRTRPANSQRSRADIEEIRNAIYVFAEANRPVTVRQTFYHLIALWLIAKDEAAYKTTVCRLMLEMRRSGELPYAWVADNTRWIRKPETFDSVADALAETARLYRRAVWRDLPVNLEIWVEKDSLAGVIAEETDPYDVPLMVARGFSSDSYLWQVSEQIQASTKATHIFYFGDWDPAGTRADIGLEAKLRGFCPMSDIHFERVALTPERIEEFHLPTRPTKGQHMNRAFRGESVDLDALPPAELRRLVRDVIERHIPAGHMAAIEAAERSEKEIFTKICGVSEAHR